MGIFQTPQALVPAAFTSGGMTLLSTTTLSGASITLSSIPATYRDLKLIIRSPLPATDSTSLRMTVNSTTGIYLNFTTYGSMANQTLNGTNLVLQESNIDNAVANGTVSCYFHDYTSSSNKLCLVQSFSNNTTTTTNYNSYFTAAGIRTTSAISSITIQADSGNLTSGTALLYGVS